MRRFVILKRRPEDGRLIRIAEGAAFKNGTVAVAVDRLPALSSYASMEEVNEVFGEVTWVDDHDVAPVMWVN